MGIEGDGRGWYRMVENGRGGNEGEMKRRGKNKERSEVSSTRVQ